MVALLFVCEAAAQAGATPAPDEVRQLIKAGRYADAEAAARRHLAATEAATGCESLETAQAMDLLVDALWRGGKAKSGRAAELAEEALAVKEKAVGERDQRVSASLVNAANAWKAVGNQARARALLERAFGISIDLWGPDDRRVALIHHNLGSTLYELEPRESERHLREALRIYESAAGPESDEVADALNGLANLAADRGDLAEAEEGYRRVIRIHEQTLGARHPKVGSDYQNLGYLHTETGDYEEARSELEHALSILQEALGREHPKTLMPIGNLAIACELLGLPVEDRWEETLSIAERVLGRDHPMTVRTLANFAVTLSKTDPARAERLNEEAYSANSRIYGPEHPETLWVLTHLGLNSLAAGDVVTAERRLREAVAGFERNEAAPRVLAMGAKKGLARCLGEAGKASEARSIFEEVLASDERALGPQHPVLASDLAEYAEFLRREGDLSGARAALERALAIREKALGPEHPETGDALFALADLEAASGRFDAALSHFRRAASIVEKARAPEDPRNAKGYRDYAACLLRAGEPAAALERALKAEEVTTRMLRATLAGVPERQALGLVAKASSGLGLAVAAAAALGKPEASTRVLDALVRSRALVLDEMSRRQRSLRAGEAGDAAALFDAWVAARDRLARLTVLGGDEKSPQKYRARLEKARAEKEAAERALADRSWEFRDEGKRDAAGLAEVKAALPAGGALVAFVKYPRVTRAKAGAAPAPATESYAAFVLRHGAKAPVLVPLGRASAVDDAAAAVRASIGATAASLGGPGGAPTAPYRRLAATLADLAWRPLRPHLSGARTAFVVPDGSLQLVSFAALPSEADAWLLEKGPVFHYLSAERDLVVSGGTKGSGLLVAGAPDFDSAPSAASAAARLRGPEAAEAPSPVHRGPPATCRGFASLRFAPLPAALAEIDDVAGLWREGRNGTGSGAAKGAPPLVLSGAAATERAVKENAPGRRVVHLTTHGFYLGDCAAKAGAATRTAADALSAAVQAENPLLLSGLAFAGANRRAEAPPGADDGVLTAEEVAALDLSGVSWAVLSACESGRGEARAGEGLFGLRRAFQVAGARTLVTSLWPVEDEASRRFMKALYEGRFARGLDTARAVHEASLSVLRERRAAGESTHPFFWAGFVAAGDWR